MQKDFDQRFQQAKKGLNEDMHLTLEKLGQLQTEIKKTIDLKINQFSKKNNYLRKIKVPKSPIKLWQFRQKQVQLPINWRYLLSAPFIYSMIIPSTLFHLCLEIYHQTCFRLYGIPLVNRQDYFIYDRQLMSQLNAWERINCRYCSYVNNLIAYAGEIGGRTERYWCPIKYYRRVNNQHSQYDKFLDSEDSKELHKQWKELRDFSDIDKKNA